MSDRMEPQPFGEVGGTYWPGLAKLNEECGELIQVIGKIMAYPLGTSHPDGGPDLTERLSDELADVMAAAEFVLEKNRGIPDTTERWAAKTKRFNAWHEGREAHT